MQVVAEVDLKDLAVETQDQVVEVLVIQMVRQQVIQEQLTLVVVAVEMDMVPVEVQHHLEDQE
tara:strand:+ start:391 stop:579 length:189 start_codon:yes stop_codon:yes gene_type:complete